MPQGRSKIPRATTKTKQIPLPLRAGQEDPGFIWCFTESGALILLIRKRYLIPQLKIRMPGQGHGPVMVWSPDWEGGYLNEAYSFSG